MGDNTVMIMIAVVAIVVMAAMTWAVYQQDEEE